MIPFNVADNPLHVLLPSLGAAAAGCHSRVSRELSLTCHAGCAAAFRPGRHARQLRRLPRCCARLATARTSGGAADSPEAGSAWFWRRAAVGMRLTPHRRQATHLLNELLVGIWSSWRRNRARPPKHHSRACRPRRLLLEKGRVGGTAADLFRLSNTAPVTTRRRNEGSSTTACTDTENRRTARARPRSPRRRDFPTNKPTLETRCPPLVHLPQAAARTFPRRTLSFGHAMNLSRRRV